MRRTLTMLAGGAMAAAVGLGGPTVASARTVPADASPVAAPQAMATTTTLTASRASSSYDSTVTFTATVSAGSGSPAGSVRFTDVSNGGVLATEKLGDGVATLTTAALAPGARKIVAHYQGNASFAGSTSAALSFPVAAAGSDAVGYQIDGPHDGDQPRGTLHAATLTRKWRVDLYGGYASYPLVAAGRVFLTEGNGVGTVWLYALDAATGKTDWSTVVFNGNDPGYVTLAYDGQRVFALTPAGTLAGYAAATGGQLWAVQLPGQSTFGEPPAAYDGVVYASGAGVGGTVYAVSEEDGRVRWMQPVMDGIGSSPAVNGSGVYVSYDQQQDYRFRLGGGLVWHYEPGGDGGGGSIPALYDGSVYARGDPNFDSPLILSAASGKVTGSFASDGEPAFAGSSMYTVAGGDLVASASTGSPARWTFAGHDLDTAPVVSDGAVYALSTRGTVFGVSVATGKKLWSGSVGQATNGPVLSGLAIGGGLLLAPAGSSLTAFGG